MHRRTVATVFLSYRHEGENPEHVRAFAERLELAGHSSGLKVVLDQFAQQRQFNGGGPDDGWPRWSRAQAGNPAHKILIVASPGWFRCYEGTEVPASGLGASAEAGVIEQLLYNQAGVSPNIRIVTFAEMDPLSVPLNLQRYHRFLDPRDFTDLLKWLTDGESAAAGAATEWLTAAPALLWSMADHLDVREAFAQLLTRGAKFRYLPMCGPSDRGKTQLTRLLLGNAFRCPGIACGRFDFKGVTDVDAECQRFGQHLGIPLPPAHPNLTHRFNAMLSELRAAAKPTLLIFDTFEAADAAAEKWIKDDLLVELARRDWLRVVIAGQRVPQRTGETWEANAHHTITLEPPEPEDWFEFGREHKPDITLDFVKEAHRVIGGKASLLAQLLGPAA